MFRENTNKFYRCLNKQEAIPDLPTQLAVETFWRGILENDVKHNDEATWIKDEQRTYQEITLLKWHDLCLNDVLKVIKRAQNWKSPGPDKLQNFWIKSFTSLHQDLDRAMNENLRDPKTIPEWLKSGVTFLLFKGKDPKDPKNYRLITCLPTMYNKILTAAISEMLYDRLLANNILPDEQKGCKDQLLISKMTVEDAKKRTKNLSMAWIDYKKAFDSVPHSWILEALRFYKVCPIFIKFLEQSMKDWNTEMYLHYQNGTVQTGKIGSKRGIFQGYSL